MMGSKAFENPLLGHARMRALFRALVETRALSKPLGKAGLPRFLEACWVGTAIDLRADDLISEARGPALLEHIQAVGLRTGSGKPSAKELKKTLAVQAKPFPGEPVDRLLCAVGSAMAQRSAGQGGIVVAYVAQRDLTGAAWKRFFQIAAVGDLPLIVVALPSPQRAGRPTDLARLAGKMIPVIPTDASDAVALYRVAQEAAVRARAQGGTMVIDCVASGVDPIVLLADQLVSKRICTRRWIASVISFAAPLAPKREP
jgi:hypothetical protein